MPHFLETKDFTFINADDNGINRFSITMTLQNLHQNVLEAADGEEVMDLLEKLKGKKIIILLDLNMPVLSGYDVIRKICNAPDEYKLVKIIVISGSFYSEFQKKELDSCISSYVEKPYSEQELIMKITACTKEF